MLKSVKEKETPDGVNNCYCFFLLYFFFLGESKNCFKVLKRCSNQLKPESDVNLEAQGVYEYSFVSVSFPVAAIQGSDESRKGQRICFSSLLRLSGCLCMQKSRQEHEAASHIACPVKKQRARNAYIDDRF